MMSPHSVARRYVSTLNTASGITTSATYVHCGRCRHAGGTSWTRSHNHAAASSMRPASGRYMRRSTARSAIGNTDDVGARINSVHATAKVNNGCVRLRRTARYTSPASSMHGTSTPGATGARARGQAQVTHDDAELREEVFPASEAIEAEAGRGAIVAHGRRAHVGAHDKERA